MITEKYWKDIYYRIINEADVIFEILDARNPLGTRNRQLEVFVKNHAPDRKIFLILNKIDLVPPGVLRRWIDYFEKNRDGYIEPKVFTVSARYRRGIAAFKRELERIFPRTDRIYRAIIVGYPNTGKSSLIYALTKGKKKVGISSSAGYTRGVMEITLTDNIHLLDTPGVIPLSEKNEMEQALKAVINPEKINDKEAVAYRIIEVYVTPSKILEFYGIDRKFAEKVLGRERTDRLYGFIGSFTPIGSDSGAVIDIKDRRRGRSAVSPAPVITGMPGATRAPGTIPMEYFYDIIRLIGNKLGLLKSGGEVNETAVYIKIIHAWQKADIRFYCIPPDEEPSSGKNL